MSGKCIWASCWTQLNHHSPQLHTTLFFIGFFSAQLFCIEPLYRQPRRNPSYRIGSIWTLDMIFIWHSSGRARSLHVSPPSLADSSEPQRWIHIGKFSNWQLASCYHNILSDVFRISWTIATFSVVTNDFTSGGKPFLSLFPKTESDFSSQNWAMVQCPLNTPHIVLNKPFALSPYA